MELHNQLEDILLIRVDHQKKHLQNLRFHKKKKNMLQFIRKRVEIIIMLFYLQIIMLMLMNRILKALIQMKIKMLLQPKIMHNKLI